jgi:hypothetical protein
VNERTRRTLLIGVAIVLAVLSIVAGALIALSSDEGTEAGPSDTPSTSPSPAESDSPTVSPAPTETPSPEPGESESAVLEDGRHLVYVDTAFRPQDAPARIRFDLVYWFTGDEAEEVAAQHGTEATNGYYIENDNPRLRTLPLADEVEVQYVPEGRCCEVQPGDVDAWLASVQQTEQTDYPEGVPWWITVEGGRITRIEQQFLP